MKQQLSLKSSVFQVLVVRKRNFRHVVSNRILNQENFRQFETGISKTMKCFWQPQTNYGSQPHMNPYCFIFGYPWSQIITEISG